MSNKNITDELVFVECRQPYILQVTDEYQYFRLGLFCVQILAAVLCFGLWLKLRPSLPRLAMRPLGVTVLFFICAIVEPTLNSLTEGLLNQRTIFNNCTSFQFWYHFLITALSMGHALNLFQYYSKYKLYEAVTKQKPYRSKRTSSANETVAETSRKLSKLHKFTTDKFITKLSCVAVLLSALTGFGVSLIFCPELNDNSSCPHREGVVLDTYIYGVGVLFGVFMLTAVIYSTIKYPDPFGVIREVLVSTIIFFFQVIAYFSLIEVFKFSDGKLYSFTPFLGVSFFGFCQFLFIFPYQIYKARQNESIELTLEEILNTKAALKIFRVHLDRELSVENLNFYLKVKTFKSKFNSNEDYISFGKKITERFVEAGSIEEINISYDARVAIVNTFEKDEVNINISVFDEAELTVLGSMQNESYIRFINGPLYRLYLGLNLSADETSRNIETRL